MEVGISENESEALQVDWNWERTHFSPFHNWYKLRSGNNSTDSDDVPIFLIEGIGISVVAGLGIIGNLLSAWILSRRKMKSSINCILLGLALTDLLLILNGTFTLAIPRICIFYKINLFKYRFSTLIPTIYAIGITTHTASVLFTLAVTLERYMAVQHPIQARIFCTLTRARITVVAIVMFSILYNIPRWFEYGYFITVQPGTGEKYYMLVTMPIRKNPLYVKWIFSVHFSLLYIIPMTLIVLFNILIYRGIKLARLQRETLSASQVNENSMAVMLLVVVLVFLACNVLPIVNLTSRIITGSSEIYGLDSIRNFLWIFNSSVNFVVYYAYSERFREMFIELWPKGMQWIFCCKPAVRRKSILSTTASKRTYTVSKKSKSTNNNTVSTITPSSSTISSTVQASAVVYIIAEL